MIRTSPTRDDRFLLAHLYEISGDRPKALKVYRDLNLKTKNPRDLETLNRRPAILAQFVNGVLRYHNANDDQDLIDAQVLVDELKQLQPDPAQYVVLRWKSTGLRNQLDKAVELIQTSAARSGLAPSRSRPSLS